MQLRIHLACYVVLVLPTTRSQWSCATIASQIWAIIFTILVDPTIGKVQWNYCQLSMEGNVVHHSISVLRHTRIQLLQTAMQGNMAVKVLEMPLLPSSYQFMLVHYVSHRVIANETNQHQLWHFTKTNQYISTLAFESWILETLSSDGELLPFDNISFTDLWEIAQWISLQGTLDSGPGERLLPP